MDILLYLIKKKDELLDDKIRFISMNKYEGVEKIRIDSEIYLIDEMISEVKYKQ